MDVVKNFLQAVACYTDKYHDFCQNESDAPLVIGAVMILVVLAVVGWLVKSYVEAQVKALVEKSRAQEDFSELIPGVLESIKYAKANNSKLAEMSPEELRYQIQYWKEFLRHAKSAKELLDIQEILTQKFTPAPEVAWRFGR